MARSSSFDVRFGVKDADVVRRALLQLGDEGKAALGKLEKAAKDQEKATRGARGQLQGFRKGLGDFLGEATRGVPVLGGLTNATRGFGAGLGGIGIAVGGAVAGLALMTRQAIASADVIGDVADRVGVTTGALQELRFAASQVGVQQNTLDLALQRFSRRVGEAAKGSGELLGTIQKYNIAITDSSGNTRRNEDILLDLADAIRNASSQQEALSIAFKAFDSEGAALVNLLRSGSAGLEAMAARARELGVVIDDDLIRSAGDASDKMDALAFTLRAKVNVALLDNADSVEKLADAFTTLLPTAINRAASALDPFADLLKQVKDLVNDFDLDKLNTLIETINPLNFLPRLFGLPGAAEGGRNLAAALDVRAGRGDDGSFARAEEIRLAALQRAVGGGTTSAGGVGGLPPDKSALAERARLLKEIKKLELEAARAGLEGIALVEKRREQELARFTELLEQGKIDDEAFERARVALAERAENEIGEIRREAAEKTATEQRRLAEQAAKEVERVVDRVSDRVVDIGADAIETIFDKGKVEDFWQGVLDLGKRTLAQLASEALVRPVVVQIVGSVVGAAPALFGLSGNAAAAAQAGGGAGGIGAGDLLNLGSQAGDIFGLKSAFSGLTSALNSFGASIGFAAPASFGTGFGPGGAASAVFDAPAFTGGTSGIFGATTATQFLGGVGLGFTAGTLLNSLVGGNSLGGTIGAGIGAAIGTAILPGIGSILGGAAGGLFGGLFGNNRPSVGPATRVNVDIVNGRAQITGGDAADGGNLGASRQFAQAFADALNSIPEMLGAAGFAAGTTLPGADFGTVAGQVRVVQNGVRSFGSAEEAFDAALLGFLTRQVPRFQAAGLPVFEGLSPAVSTALGRTQATTLEGLASDVDFARNLERIAGGLTESANELERIEDAAKATARQQGEALFEFRDRAESLGLLNLAGPAIDQAVDSLLNFVESDDKITDAERAIAALRGQFDGLGEILTDLGRDAGLAEDAFRRSVDAIREGFDESNRLAVLRITDPLKAALEAFDKEAERRVREAEALGANIVLLERRNALERQRVIEQATQAQSGGLQRFLEELTFGRLSGATPGGTLEGLRAAFQATGAQALAGDVTARGRIVDLGRSFLESSRGFFASGTGFQQDLTLVQSVVSQLLPAQDAVVAAINDGASETARLLTRLANDNAELKEHLAELVEINAGLRADLARVLNQ